MKPALPLLLAALLGLGFTATGRSDPAGPAQRTIYVLNNSTSVSPAQLANALPAFQAAVSEDFARYWGIDAHLVIAAKAPSANAWTLSLDDTLDCGFCAGYHYVSGSGVPYGHVLANDGWQVTFTHELFELLADPHVDRSAWDGRSDIRLLEVADPVEADRFAYERPGADGTPVLISDFVTERWYIAGSRGPFDFARRVRRPLTLLSGGYVNVWAGDHWREEDAF